MAENKISEEPLDIDDLLGFTDAELETPAAPEPVKVPVKRQQKTAVVAAPVETAAAQRIRELKAALDKPAPVYVAEEEELTAEDIEIRELEDRLARKTAAEQEAAPEQFARPAKGEAILVHFVAHGFTAQGQIWQRGQEVEFEVGGEAFKQTLDRNGKSWLDVADDAEEQYRRWGQEFFRPGPWKGRPFADVTGLTKAEDIADAFAAAAAERKRNRAAPIVR